jgi:hypothetical protein
VAIIAPPRTATAAPLAARLARFRGIGLAFQRIAAIAGRRLLAFATERLGLQFAVLAPEMFDFLFQRRDAPAGLGMHALPVARLLPQFEILAPQSGHFAAQGSYFLAELCDRLHCRSQACRIQDRFEEEPFHNPLVLVISWG